MITWLNSLTVAEGISVAVAIMCLLFCIVSCIGLIIATYFSKNSELKAEREHFAKIKADLNVIVITWLIAFIVISIVAAIMCIVI